MTFFVILLFVFYVAMDCISMIPRISGAVIGKNSLGYSFSVMGATIKRVFVVAYPPVLGWLSLNGFEIYNTIYLSYFFSIIGVVVVYFVRDSLVGFFIRFIESYALNGAMGPSFFGAFTTHKAGMRRFFTNAKNVDRSLVVIASWVYLVYGSSLFVINVLGHHFSDLGPIIYQTIGLINALGTIVFAFVLDPRISRVLDAGGDVIVLHNSLLLAQLVNLVVLGPLIIYGLSVVLEYYF